MDGHLFISLHQKVPILLLIIETTSVQLLVAAGADINAINNKGQKPFDLVPTYWDTCDGTFELFTSACRKKLVRNQKLREILNPLNSDLDLDMESSP